MSGADLVRWTINQIVQRPQLWDQRFWHCGSSHCFFGWADIAYSGARDSASFPGKWIGELLVPDTYLEEAMRLPYGSAVWLRQPERTLRELWVFCREFLAGRLASNWGEETKQSLLRIIEAEADIDPYTL